MADQILGVEMVVALEDFGQDDAPLLRHPLAAALQKLFEPLERRERYFDRSQRKIVSHVQLARRTSIATRGRMPARQRFREVLEPRGPFKNRY